MSLGLLRSLSYSLALTAVLANPLAVYAADADKSAPAQPAAAATPAPAGASAAATPAQPAAAASPAAATTAASSTQLTGQVSVYPSAQQVWDDCYRLKTACSEMLDEGRYAPSRKKWAIYYAATIQQLIADMQKSTQAGNYPQGLLESDKGKWDAIAGTLAGMQPDVQAMVNAAASLKAPTDDKYPATFWGPARSILKAAGDIDKNVIDVLAGLESSGAPQAAQGSVTKYGKTNSLEGLVRASQKVSTATLDMAAELDRFNLSFAKAPTQPLQNEMYQGAFTKQEILSQYKYMPSFVFTTDPSVARFTYRLPARKNMLEYYTNQIGNLLNLMDSEMLAVQASLPEGQDGALAAPWQAMKEKYVDARNQYTTLLKMVEAVTDKQLQSDIRGELTTFGAPILAIRNDMDQLRTAINDYVAIGKK